MANMIFIDCARFRLVTLRDVSLLLQPGIWTASIGLDDEFSTSRWTRHLAASSASVGAAGFGCSAILPFGLCLDPLILTRVTKTPRRFFPFEVFVPLVDGRHSHLGVVQGGVRVCPSSAWGGPRRRRRSSSTRSVSPSLAPLQPAPASSLSSPSGSLRPAGDVVPAVPTVSLLHAPRSPVEDRQRDGVGLREERRWYDISPLLLLTRECSSSLTPSAFASSLSSSRRRRISARMRRRASSHFRIGIFLQRFSTPSAFVGAVRTSTSSRRQHRRIFLASSRGATLKKRKRSTLSLRGGVSGSPTPSLLLLFFLASFGSWRCRLASFSSSLRIGRRRSGSRPFSVFLWRKCSACRRVRK